MKKLVLICCFAMILSLSGCTKKMSQDQKNDNQAAKDIKIAVEKFNKAENLHMVIHEKTGAENNLNVKGDSIYELNVSGSDFAGTHTYIDISTNNEVTDYVYKRGDTRITYIISMKNAYNLPSTALPIDLKEELSFTSSIYKSDEIIENYDPIGEFKKNKDGSFTYTNKGVSSTGMKNPPVFVISSEKELVEYTDLMGNTYTFDGYNSSPLDFKYIDCIQGKCMYIDY